MPPVVSVVLKLLARSAESVVSSSDFVMSALV